MQMDTRFLKPENTAVFRKTQCHNNLLSIYHRLTIILIARKRRFINTINALSLYSYLSVRESLESLLKANTDTLIFLMY